MLVLRTTFFVSNVIGMTKNKTPKLEIPTSALKPKYFEQEEAEKLVPEIKAFIKETGTPHLWRGHTHTKPPVGANIIYLGEFDLPASHQREDKWAPCPCCVPEHPKYKINGKIAYFPDEKVIRNIGPQCFRALNPEGHDDAIEAFYKKKERERQINFLIDNLHILPAALKAIQHNILIAQALDLFRTEYKRKISGNFRTKLWRAISSGRLYRLTEHVVHTNAVSGPSQKIERRKEIYSSIEGYDLINPKRPGIAPVFESALERLQAITVRADTQAVIEIMDDAQREQVVKNFTEGLGEARRAYDTLCDVRKFLQPISINTLRTWGALDDAEMSLYIEKDGNTLLIGETKEHPLKITVSSDIDTFPKSIPQIGQGKVEAQILKTFA